MERHFLSLKCYMSLDAVIVVAGRCCIIVSIAECLPRFKLAGQVLHEFKLADFI